MAHILVIDDDQFVCGMIRQILEGVGHTVVEAPNGRLAMRMWRDNPPDLTITDILMPEQDGLGFIRELRREQPNAKIIALSGGSRKIDLNTLEIAKHLGAARTLEKPFDVRDLLDAVTTVLGTT
jgi:CheY-like chemotaxis protein